MSERQIFEHALELTDPARREQFLSHACGVDQELRQRIDALLTSHDEQSRFLETPVVQQIQTPPDSSGEATVQLPPGTYAAHDDDSDALRNADLSFLKPSTKPGSIGVLGHYEILQVLGQGAFGIVFKAFDEKLQRHVAIKTMNVQMAATSPPRKRFLREARAAAAIRHDNVTQVYSVEEEPIPYLVMEYIDGITLHTKLNSVGPLDIPEMLHLGKQIALGLAAAHEKGLVHRDIKPGNILLEKGAEQKVKITDFGLARAADDASLTQSGLIAGTPLYMAPEQALGQALDARTDLFSFGSVLYQMAAGHPPFRAPTTVAVLRRVVDDTQRPLKEIIPEIPDWFAAIVNKLLAKKPDDRYQSAREVADLLMRCQSELQLTGQVTCVPGAGSVSTRSTPNDTTNTDRSKIRKNSAEPLVDGGRLTTSATTPNAQKPPLKTVLYSLFLVSLAMSPILFGKQISEFISPLFWGQIPTLPVVERAAGLRFDGKDDFIQVPAQWDSPALTIEAFVTPDGFANGGTVLELTNEKHSGMESIELFDEPSQSQKAQSFVRVLGGSSHGTVAAPLNRAFRQHRAVTLDDQYLHYYVNGMWQAKRKVHPQDQQLWKLRQLTIGCKEDRTNFFTGVIDQLRISKIVRYKNNFAPITSVQSDDSTLSLYDFDEGTGDVLRDSSGNGADGKILGAQWVHPAKGLQFDGVDDYVDFENLAWSSNQYTFETWITPLAEHGTLFQIAVPEGNLHSYLYEGGSGSGLNRDKSYTNVNGPRAGMKRQHLATVFDGKNLSYFIDGKLAGSKTNVCDLTTPWMFQRLRIGGKVDPNSSKPEFFHGRMEQFRVSKSALYVLPFTPEETLQPTANTIALYNFDENQGDVLKDATGHGHDGKIVGARWVKSLSMAGSGARTFHSGEWFDVLSLIDPSSDKFDLPGMTGRNDWKREGNHLVIGPDKLASKLVLPLDSTWSAFECELEFTRRSGAGGLNLNIPTRKGECSVVIDHASGKGGVFLGARDKGVVLSEGRNIEGGKLTTLNVTVRRVQNQDQITVSLNGKAAGQWTGNRNDIGKESTERFPVSRRISLWIHEGNNEFEFQRIRLRPLEGESIATTRPQTGWHGWPEDAPQPAIAPFTAEQAKQHQSAWAKHLGIPREFTDKHGMKFVLIPPGEFQMGFASTELDTLTRELKQAGANEFDLFSASTSGPQHQVRITQPIYMSAHEVTIAQYRTFLEETRYLPTADQLGGKMKWTNFVPQENPDSYPVDGVSWTDADSFCVLRSQKDGVTYRLPNEAEWEFACRAGSTTLWSFGDNPGQLGEYAATTSAGVTQLQPVGSRKPNAFGLFDMYCNAEEWCRDWHVRDYYAKSNVDDPVYLETPADANSGRVTRGGSLSSAVWMTRSSLRRWDYPSTPVSPKGFRVVITGDLKKSVKAIGLPDDRETAEWLLALPGSTALTLAGHPTAVSRSQDLPADTVKVISVKLDGVTSEAFGDTELVRLGQLSELQSLLMLTADNQPLLRITDAGIAQFAQTPAAKSLKVFECYSSLPKITDSAMPFWNQFTVLYGLQLQGTQISNAGLHLLKSPTLAELRIFDSPQITPAAFEGALDRLPALTALRLKGVSLGVADLTPIARLPLQVLQLTDNGLEDRSVAPLVQMGSLKNLSLGSNRNITDEAVRTLSEIKSLEVLTLDETGITDAACEMLAHYPALTTVGLNSTAITDTGLVSLAKRTQFHELHLRNCPKITTEGLQKLRQTLPECQVFGDVAEPMAYSWHGGPQPRVVLTHTIYVSISEVTQSQDKKVTGSVDVAADAKDSIRCSRPANGGRLRPARQES